MQQEPASPVRASRIRRGLTLAQVAEKCAKEQGVPLSESHLSRIERGEYVGSPKVRAAVAAVLDLDPLHDFEGTPA